MSDTTGSFSNYQRQIYGYRQPPVFTMELDQLESLAREKLSKEAFWYVGGSAGSGETERTNKSAFKDYRITPSMLVDSNIRDLSTTLFGVKYSSPVFIAPIGVCGIWHEEGELAVARASQKLKIPMIMSTAATKSIEAVAGAQGDVENGSQRWYQLYWPKSDDITISLLNRAKASGFTTLVVTLDTTLLGHRPKDLDSAYLPFLDGEGCQVGFSDPVFCKRMGITVTEDFKDVESTEEGNKLSKEELIRRISMAWLGEVNSGVFRTWKDLEFLKQNWQGPILLKGIQTVKDAKLAIQHQISGIIVSNHGGRQVDGASSSLSCLDRITSDEEIKNSDLTIMFDSGIRGGSDVIKALALGAKAVLLGRPWVYGLSLEGQAGVEHVLKSLLCEVETSLGLIGCPKSSELNRDFLEKVRRD